MPGVCRTTHGGSGTRPPGCTILCFQRRPFCPADGFPPEPLKGPVRKVRLGSWANRSSGCANGPEGRNRDKGSSQGAVGDMFAERRGHFFLLKPPRGAGGAKRRGGREIATSIT